MKRKRRFKKNRFRRGIYILPNIFTSLNIFCGFYAIISAIDGRYVVAAVSILIAVVFDALDGKIARATNTASKFGAEYDSLADLTTFGLASGLMIYLWVLEPMGRIGWLAALLFLVCGALRLARFNAQAGTTNDDYFTGLPIPAAAAMNASVILLCHRFNIPADANPVLILVMLYILAFLMVSTIKYSRFKKPELFRRVNLNVLVAAILILIFIAAQPSIALFLLASAYIVSGPFTTLWLIKIAKQKKVEAGKTDAQESDSV